MAYSKNTFPGDGASTDFQIDFPYLEAEHVGVTVDGVSTDFTWTNDSTVNITPAPALDAEIVVSRDSSRASRISSYADQQMLNMAALNYDALQSFYMAQEAFDAISSAVLSAGAGDLLAANNLSEVNPASARNNIGAAAKADPVITGVLTLDDAPTDPLHATTKAYVDAAIAAIPAGSGEVNTGSNLGAGETIFKQKTGVDFEYRTLVQGTGVVLTADANTITIDATGVGGGEVNTGANLNVTGEALYTGKSGVALQFKGVGESDTSLTKTVSANDVLFKINRSAALTWLVEQQFSGGTTVPTISSALHGIDVAGGALDNVSKRVTRTSPNAGAVQVQSADVVHVQNVAGSNAYDWARLTILDNASNAGGDQVGDYVKAYKRSASSHTWGRVTEVVNTGGDKTYALYGEEISTQSNGTETNVGSGPLALYYGSLTGAGGGGGSADDVASVMDHGLLISQVFNRRLSRLTYGIRMEGRFDTAAIAQGAAPAGQYSGASMIAANGNYTGAVIDTAGIAAASCALRAKSGVPIRMSGVDSNARDMVWNSGSNRMEFQYAGNNVFDIPVHTGATKTYAFGMFTTAAASFTKVNPTDGAASPKNPVTYIRVQVDGNNYRLALYND